MKALKKVLLGITAMAMTVAMFSFVACTDDNPDDSTSTSVTSSTTTSSETSNTETSDSSGETEVKTITYTGEYKYENAWVTGSYYGVKVSVTVDEDEKITDVSIVESDYVTVTDSWENKSTWDNGVDALLANYVGKSAVDIMAQYVDLQTSGEPTTQTTDGFNAYDSDLLISGATQGSGRLLLAVQNALEGAGYSSYAGEYKYENAWVTGSYYGIKVNVVVKDNTIQKIAIIDSDYVSVTDSWENKTTWEEGIDGLLAAYEGKNVVDVMAQYIDLQTSGEPTTQATDGFNAYDSDLLITGATQGSGRLLLAVQNALEGAGYSSYAGEYKYENAWVTGSYYGIKVNVVVKDNTIQKVVIIDSDYVSVTDSWENKTVWEEGIDGLLAAYEGKTVTEVLAITVACSDSGEPIVQTGENFVSYDSDLLLTGATQGSGRLVLAVQNALASLATA